MNKEIFKLEELLKQTEPAIPYFFNYREENRPAPFGEACVELKNEELRIEVGPPALDTVSAQPAGTGDDDLLTVILLSTGKYHEEITADVAFSIIKDEFLRHRAEWWPEVYGNAK